MSRDVTLWTRPYWWDADALATPDYGTRFGEDDAYVKDGVWRVQDGECLNPYPDDADIMGPEAFGKRMGLRAESYSFASVPDSVEWKAWKRERWGKTAVAVEDEHGEVAMYLTPPEYVLAREHGALRAVRKEADHDVLSIMAASLLADDGASYPDLPPFRGCPLEIPATADVLMDGRERTVLRREDVAAAWPYWTLMWRAQDALVNPYIEGVPAVPLSRFQVGPWLGMSERKAEAFVQWVEAEGYVVPEATRTRFGEAHVYLLVDAS